MSEASQLDEGRYGTGDWLSRGHRLARDHEPLPETGVTIVHAAMSRIMLRRVAG